MDVNQTMRKGEMILQEKEKKKISLLKGSRNTIKTDSKNRT